MRPPVRAALETAMVHGLLGWLYVAALAAFRPHTLDAPIASVLPVRRDTFGACCFAASAAASFALRLHNGRAWERRAPRPGPAEALPRTVTGYALAAWSYLCVNSLTHPATIALPLTHFAAVPTEGTTASVCFTASAAALFALRARSTEEPRPGGAAR